MKLNLFTAKSMKPSKLEVESLSAVVELLEDSPLFLKLFGGKRFKSCTQNGPKESFLLWQEEMQLLLSLSKTLKTTLNLQNSK